MFQFPTFAPAMRVTGLQPAGLPHSDTPDQRSFAPPRGFSQLIASFVASESQGIHRLPLLTFSPPHLTCGLMYLKLALLDFFFYSFSLLLMSNMSKILLV